MEELYFSFGLKIIRVILSYIAVTIATNYTSQIYIDKVLVNQENPPHLINMCYLFVIIEFCMFVICVALVYFVLSNVIDNVVTKKSIENIMQIVLIDYVLGTIVSVITLNIIGNAMYSKKYFLYKDDGLRAIRAYGSIMTQISILNNLIPYNFLVNGAMSAVQKKS